MCEHTRGDGARMSKSVRLRFATAPRMCERSFSVCGFIAITLNGLKFGMLVYHDHFKTDKVLVIICWFSSFWNQFDLAKQAKFATSGFSGERKGGMAWYRKIYILESEGIVSHPKHKPQVRAQCIVNWRYMMSVKQIIFLHCTNLFPFPKEMSLQINVWNEARYISRIHLWLSQPYERRVDIQLSQIDFNLHFYPQCGAVIKRPILLDHSPIYIVPLSLLCYNSSRYTAPQFYCIRHWYQCLLNLDN